LGHVPPGGGRAEGKAAGSAGEKTDDRNHFLQAKEFLAEEVGEKLDDDGAVEFGFAGVDGTGAPGVGEIRPEQDDVSGTVVSDAVSDEALAIAIDNQGQLILGVVMPEEGEAPIIAFEGDE
jgi:hypothetical protein